MRLKIQDACFAMLSLMLSFVSVSDSAAQITDPERGALLAADAVTRGFTDSEGDLYRLDVPSATVVTLDVMTPAVEENSIAILWQGAEPLDTVYRSATRWVIGASTAKTLELRVVTRHPGRYKIVTQLTARPFGTPAKTDPEIVDPEPEPDGFQGPGGCRRLEDLRKTDPEVVDPEPEPDGFDGGSSTGLDAGCGSAGRADDHGDTPSCATPLAVGAHGAGTLSNAWGDDVDVFVLDLDHVTFLELDLRGEVTMTFESSAGHRLAMTEGVSGIRSLNLSPGRYFARVEGIGVDATYELRVASSSW